MVAAMTSGRILTFIGDVSRTSNALKSIQASREGRDVSFETRYANLMPTDRNGSIWNQPTSRPQKTVARIPNSVGMRRPCSKIIPSHCE